MNDKEYAEWIISDTMSQVVPALVIYAVVLTAYWVFIG
jgi:hypothetical protein